VLGFAVRWWVLTVGHNEFSCYLMKVLIKMKEHTSKVQYWAGRRTVGRGTRADERPVMVVIGGPAITSQLCWGRDGGRGPLSMRSTLRSWCGK
jgi:hypothetical protein